MVFVLPPVSIAHCSSILAFSIQLFTLPFPCCRLRYAQFEGNFDKIFEFLLVSDEILFEVQRQIVFENECTKIGIFCCVTGEVVRLPSACLVQTVAESSESQCILEANSILQLLTAEQEAKAKFSIVVEMKAYASLHGWIFGHIVSVVSAWDFSFMKRTPNGNSSFPMAEKMAKVQFGCAEKGVPQLLLWNTFYTSMHGV